MIMAYRIPNNNSHNNNRSLQVFFFSFLSKYYVYYQHIFGRKLKDSLFKIISAQGIKVISLDERKAVFGSLDARRSQANIIV